MARVCFFVARHISSWQRFLSQSHGDLNQVQSRLVALLKEQLGEKLLICGGYLAWVDTPWWPRCQTRCQGFRDGTTKVAVGAST
jgi:hypothetical protein